VLAAVTTPQQRRFITYELSRTNRKDISSHCKTISLRNTFLALMKFLFSIPLLSFLPRLFTRCVFSLYFAPFSPSVNLLKRTQENPKLDLNEENDKTLQQSNIDKKSSWNLLFELVIPVRILELAFRSTPVNPNTPALSNVWISRGLLHYRNVYLCLDNSQIQRPPQLP